MIPEMTVLENVALGGYGAHARPACCRPMLRLDRAEERQLFAEAEAPAGAHRHGRSRCTSWRATWRWGRSG